MIHYSEHFTDVDFPVGIPHPNLVAGLERAKGIYMKPIVITSGGRPPDVNAEVGGVKESTHLMDVTGTFMGCDIACTDSKDRFILMGILMQCFRRIGIYQRHFHVDVAFDADHSEWVMWVEND